MKRCQELLDLDDAWLALFGERRGRPGPNDHLAPPFLSVAPDGYDPSLSPTVLYVGKATRGNWWEDVSEPSHDPTSEQCRRAASAFVKTRIVSDKYRPAFWRFAHSRSNAAGQGVTALQNLIWSNIAKLGLKDGNPCRSDSRRAARPRGVDPPSRSPLLPTDARCVRGRLLFRSYLDRRGRRRRGRSPLASRRRGDRSTCGGDRRFETCQQ